MKHPLHLTFGCMSIAFLCVLGLYEVHHSPALAQSIPLPTVIGDDDNRSVFSVESEVAPYKGSNIADAYKNGYSVLYANKSAKAKWVLPVSTATSYCVAISLPKHQLFLPEQTYKIYDGASGDSLLATVSLKQAQTAGTSSCGARLESSSTRWLETGTKVTSKTGTIRVEMTHAGVPSATTYLVLDAVELRPSGSITIPPVGLCGNGKVDGGEECDGTSALPSGRGCNKECKLTYCAVPKCPAVDPACPRLPGGGRDENGCQVNPCGVEDTSCTTKPCTSDAQCAAMQYCSTKDGDCLSGCKAGQPCADVCYGVCKTIPGAAVCGNGKLEGSEQCDDGNSKDGDGCSAKCTKEVCPAIACLKPPPAGCTTGTNANGCPDCSIIVCPNNPLRADNDTARFDVSGETKLLSNQSTAIGGSFRVAHRSWMPSAKAVWNFPNLIPGQAYEIRISTPAYQGSAQSVLYHVYDGRTEIGTFNLADISGGGASGGGSAVGGGGVAEKMASEHWLFMNKTFTSKTGTINILLNAADQKDKGWLILDAIELAKSDRIDIGFCGDGRISGNEQCDDGNTKDGDGCSANCTKELTVCGNNICEEGEADSCPACVYQTPACKAPCKQGTCQRDCQNTAATFKKMRGLCVDDALVTSDGVSLCTTKAEWESYAKNLCKGHCIQQGKYCGLDVVEVSDPCTNNVSMCGNGKVESREGCDDGNKKDGDGCNANCGVESGWQCSTSTGGGVSGTNGGQAAGSVGGGQTMGGGGGSNGNMPVEYNQNGRSYCTRVISVGFCGDGKVQGTEQCDNGSVCNNGTACSSNADCRKCTYVQAYGKKFCGGVSYFVDAARQGMVCTTDADCMAQTELMCTYNGTKDGNCDSQCQKKVSVGFCGDGICSKDEEQTYCPACPMPQPGMPAYDCSCTQVCAKDCGGSVKSCGNGKLEAGEQCDDKNTKAGDGCSPTCQAEAGWECKKRYMDGAGTPYVQCFVKRCGSGEVTSGEQCDDGNTQSGDGCSSVCKAEAGWKCTTGSRFDGVSNNSIGGGSGGGGNYEFVGYGGGPSVCVRDGLCGNGILDPGEECDGKSPYPSSGCTKTCKLSYCRALACAKPAPGCQYVTNDSIDEYGCPNSCGTLVCENEKAIFETGRGTGQYDSMTYLRYESEILLTPSATLKVTSLTPDANYCNGECWVNVIVKNGTQIVARGASDIAKNNAAITGKELNIPLSFTLVAGKTYSVNLTAGTSKSIGIFTAGSASPNTRQNGSFTTVFARSDTWDHKDRGSVGFSLQGTTEASTGDQSYFTGHTFKCHDGYSESSNSKMPMCMHADDWRKIAEQTCARRCGKTKCGVNSWQVTGANCTPQAGDPSVKAQAFVDANRDGQYSNTELSSAIRRFAADMKLTGNTSASLASDFDGSGRVDESDLLWLSDILGMTPMR